MTDKSLTTAWLLDTVSMSYGQDLKGGGLISEVERGESGSKSTSECKKAADGAGGEGTEVGRRIMKSSVYK